MTSKQVFLLCALASALVTGTAAASIPDANGVVHACYNTLTGSVRIVDAPACNLLERAVAWSQTGPVGPIGATGPVGARGPVGAQGPAGQSVTGASVNVGNPNCPSGGTALTLGGFTTYVCNGASGATGSQVQQGVAGPAGPQGSSGPQGPVGPSGARGPAGPAGAAVIGRETMFNNTPAVPSNKRVSATKRFTPAADGTCIVSVAGYMFTATSDHPNPDTLFTPVLVDVTAGTDNQDTETTFRMNGNNDPTGSTTTGFAVQANHQYGVAVDIASNQDTEAENAFLSLTVTWICQ